MSKQLRRFSRQIASDLAVIASIAYQSREDAEASLSGMGYSQELRVDLDGTAVLVCRGRLGLIVAFRGTEPTDPRDIVTDLRVGLTSTALGRVHDGFHRALEAVWASVQSVLERHADGDLWLTGHSLGGALAILCAARASAQGSPVTGVYTFGAPDVGDDEFCRQLNTWMRGRIHTVAHMQDPVPLLPGLPGYRSTGSRHLVSDHGEIASTQLSILTARIRAALEAKWNGVSDVVDSLAESHGIATYVRCLGKREGHMESQSGSSENLRPSAFISIVMFLASIGLFWAAAATYSSRDGHLSKLDVFWVASLLAACIAALLSAGIRSAEQTTKFPLIKITGSAGTFAAIFVPLMMYVPEEEPIRILTMDSHLRLYDPPQGRDPRDVEGEQNGHKIRRHLLAFSNVRVTMEPTYPDWYSVHSVIEAVAPDIVIIHFSAFEGRSDPESTIPDVRVSEWRFASVMDAFSSSPKMSSARYVVYSREWADREEALDTLRKLGVATKKNWEWLKRAEVVPLARLPDKQRASWERGPAVDELLAAVARSIDSLSKRDEPMPVDSEFEPR